MSGYEHLYPIEDAIEKMLVKEHLFAELVGREENSLIYRINWGDWKHDHLRFDWCVRELLEKLGFFVTTNGWPTEEDGSDCYSGDHKVSFIKLG